MYRQVEVRRPRSALRASGPHCARGGLYAGLLLTLPTLALAASGIVIPTDRNFGLEILDVQDSGEHTRLLYFTYPESGQRHITEQCTFNVYVLDLQPGLADVRPQQLVENHCGNRQGFRGVLASSGEVLLATDDRIETWSQTAGKVREWRLGDPVSTTGLIANLVEAGVHVALTPDGSVVLTESRVADGNEQRTAAVAFAYAANGEPRWRMDLDEPGIRLIAEDIWAADDGTALLRVSATAPGGASLPDTQAPEGIIVSREQRLYLIDRNGQAQQPLMLTRDQQPDLQAMQQAPNPLADPAAFRRLLEGGVLENIRKLAVNPRDDGGYDVLLDRSSQDSTRQGHFHIRIASDGALTSERSLGDLLTEHGLENWVDFSAAEPDTDLILLSSVSVQQSAGARRRVLDQPSISLFDFQSGDVVTRLLPIDQQYLTAYLNAGDEQIQSLSNLPGGSPIRLANLGDAPLGISIGKLSGRAAIRLDESSPQLISYTQTRDAARAAAAADEQRAQRRAASDAQGAATNARMAAAAGLTPEEFANLSNRERAETIFREGDLDAAMALVTQQAAVMQQALAAAQGGDTAAMAAAAALLQGEQTGAGTGPATAPSGSAMPDNTDVIELDANSRGWVEFDHPSGQAVTLLIIDDSSGEQAVARRYADGKVYEFIDFGRLGIARDLISVQIVDEDDRVLARPILRRP